MDLLGYAADDGRDLVDGNGVDFCDDRLDGPRLRRTGSHETREMGEHLGVVGVETVLGVEEDIHPTESREAVREKRGACGKRRTVLVMRDSHPACAPTRVCLCGRTPARRRGRGREDGRRRGKS